MADQAIRLSATDAARPMPMVIPASVVVNIAIAVASVLLALSIFAIDTAVPGDSQVVQQLTRLGRPVIITVGVVALLPLVLALWSTVGLLRRQIGGRYLALTLQYLGVVFCGIALLHLWGFFNSFELIVDGIMAAPWMLIGFPIAYALFWVGGRMERSALGRTLESLAGLIAIGTAILVLFAANILTFANNILSAYANPATWIATLLLVGFGALAWNLLKTGTYFRETQDQLAAWQGWLMLSPNIIGFMLFFAGPLILSFYLSFTDNTVGRVPNFIALDNYAEVFALEIQPVIGTIESLPSAMQGALTFGYTPLGALDFFGTTYVVGARDSVFWLSLRNTILYCLLLIPLSVIPALGLALILNSKLPGVKIFRAIYFLPSVAAVVGTALIWRWLYDPTIGFINYGISGLIDFLNRLGFQITDPEIAWLTAPATVLLSMVLLSAWQVVGFNSVLFLAGLQGIPVELNEAASIDGANRWSTLRFITIPMLAPTTFFVMITTIITGLQAFNEPYALFPSIPIPENAITSVYYLYNQGFFRFNFGYASAIAWVVFALIFLVTLIQFRLQRNSTAYSG
ncbi:MAG: sugar ABC transporter permease [Chloroflexota bacterium]|nr:sugar ABC transporter permease [Chloroflexota bacterium]